MSDFKNKDFSGSMFHEENKKTPSHPDMRGSMTVNGKDFWVSAWFKKNAAGNDFLSLAFSVKLPKGSPYEKSRKDDNIGALSQEENKKSPNAPDWRGEITLEGARFKMAAWDKISAKTHKPWKSLDITNPNETAAKSDKVTGDVATPTADVPDRSFGFPMDPGMDGFEDIPL